MPVGDNGQAEPPGSILVMKSSTKLELEKAVARSAARLPKAMEKFDIAMEKCAPSDGDYSSRHASWKPHKYPPHVLAGGIAPFTASAAKRALKVAAKHGMKDAIVAAARIMADDIYLYVTKRPYLLYSRTSRTVEYKGCLLPEAALYFPLFFFCFFGNVLICVCCDLTGRDDNDKGANYRWLLFAATATCPVCGRLPSRATLKEGQSIASWCWVQLLRYKRPLEWQRWTNL